MNDQNFKNLCLKLFIFVKVCQCAKKYCEIPKLFFYTVQRESQIKPQLKVVMEDVREPPKKRLV